MNNRIIAKGLTLSNDMYKTKLNNNDMVIGASGSGKSTGYVIPNIMQGNESMIIADTKSILYRQLQKRLEQAGFEVHVLDFVNLEHSCKYNPLDYIPFNKKTGRYGEKEIMTIANAMIPTRIQDDTLWEDSARLVLECLISFVLETLPGHEKNMASVTGLYKVLAGSVGYRLFEELEAENPDSFAVRRYKSFQSIFFAERTWGCIAQFVSDALDLYDFSDAWTMFDGTGSFQFCDMGRRKTALFVNVSDTDRTFDRLINVFYAQAFHELCKEADSRRNGRLKVPVRIFLDDFATNVYIPDFDKIISNIRSRDISVSVILQSISQLETLYSPEQAVTILNGCDHMLYLGGQDVETAGYISEKANVPMERILDMGLDDAYLFERGSAPRKVNKINLYEKEKDENGDNVTGNSDSKCKREHNQSGRIHSAGHRAANECTASSVY